MDQLKKQNPPPLDATNTTQPLNEAINHTETLIGKLERDIAALEEKIQQRLNAHGLRLSDMENFAYQIESSKAAWLELQQTKQEISKAFDAAVVDMNNTCPSRKSHPAKKKFQLERSSAILLHRPAHSYTDSLLPTYGPHLSSLFLIRSLIAPRTALAAENPALRQ